MSAPPVIDVRLIRYTTSAILGDGSEVVLDPYILSPASREETDDSFSQSLHLTLRDADTSDGRSLSELVTLGVRVLHAVSYDEGRTWDDEAVWDMEVMSFEPKDTNQTFKVVAYDPMQLLQGDMAKIHAFYPAGKVGSEVVKDIFAQFSIPTGSVTGPEVTMPKILFSGKAGDLLLKVLQHALAMGDKCYLPRWNGVSVDVVVPGVNDPIRVFDGTQNVTAASEVRDTLDRVDQATVLGAAADPDDPNRGTIVAVAQVTLSTNDETVTGIRPLVTYTDPDHAPPLKYAPKKKVKHSRKTLLRNPDIDKPKLAKDAAKVIIARQSVPQIVRDFTAFNADDVRKGDVGFFRAGRCNEYQTVLSVAHDLDARTMKVKTGAKGTALYKAQRIDVSRTALAASGNGRASNAAGLQSLFAWCKSHLGIPYAWGGIGPQSYDCSGWTAAAFREVFGVEIGGNTSAQWENNPPGDGSPGDLVLFGFATFADGTRSEHVGIVSETAGMMYDEPGPVSGFNSIQQDAAFQSRGIKGYRRPVDFSGTGAAAADAAAGGQGYVPPPVKPEIKDHFLEAAPPMLADAIRKYFPPAEWENAAGISYHETVGWTDFTAEYPNGSGPGTQPEMSYGWFQINNLAHTVGTDPNTGKLYWMNTDNNVYEAQVLWLAAGRSWCRDWKRSARLLGLCS